MINTKNNILKFIMIFSFIISVSFSLGINNVNAQTNGTFVLVPCGTLRNDPVPPATVGTISNPCDFNYLLGLVNNIVKFILFYLAVPIAAIMFAYAGFLLLTSGGDSSAKTKAKDMFLNVVIGLVVAVAAWLIVKTILMLLGYDSSWSTWFGF